MKEFALGYRRFSIFMVFYYPFKLIIIKIDCIYDYLEAGRIYRDCFIFYINVEEFAMTDNFRTIIIIETNIRIRINKNFIPNNYYVFQLFIYFFSVWFFTTIKFEQGKILGSFAFPFIFRKFTFRSAFFCQKV